MVLTDFVIVHILEHSEIHWDMPEGRYTVVVRSWDVRSLQQQAPANRMMEAVPHLVGPFLRASSMVAVHASRHTSQSAVVNTDENKDR